MRELSAIRKNDILQRLCAQTIFCCDFSFSIFMISVLQIISLRYKIPF